MNGMECLHSLRWSAETSLHDFMGKVGVFKLNFPERQKFITFSLPYENSRKKARGKIPRNSTKSIKVYNKIHHFFCLLFLPLFYCITPACLTMA